MKKIFLLMLALWPIHSMACEAHEYEVFYIPIERQYVVPPTRDDILKRSSFYIVSSKITCLFSMLNKQVQGSIATTRDYGSFRILIRDNKNGKELIILSDKVIFYEDKTYKVNHEKIDAILEELKNRINEIKKDHKK